MEALTPAPIAPTAVASARRAPMRFRIYVDGQWQAQKGDWRRVAEEMVEQAGGVVAGTFGVGFIVERVAPWPDPGPDALPARLDALTSLDPGGADVWVVGLVGGVPVTSSAFEQIGLAYTPGRHFVMRSMADVDEADALDGYNALDAADKRQILRARMAHRRAVVFLHEWGHTLGMLHPREFDVVMAETYAERTGGFGEVALAVGNAVIGAAAPEGADDATRLAAERQAALDWYTAHPEARVDRRDRDAFVAGGDALAPGVGPVPRSAAGIEAAMRAGRVTAVSAAARGSDAEVQREVSAWVSATRRLYAMPEGFPPADEADYVAAQRAAEAALEADEPAAEARVSEIEARWPEAAAGPQLRCALDRRAQRFAEAQALCAEAVHRDPASVGGWFTLGLVALDLERSADAVTAFERVVALDPGQVSAWVNLGRIYRLLGREADREALARRYLEATGEALPE